MSLNPALLRFIGRFIALVGFQVLFLNRLVLFNIAKPYVFLLFLLSIPISAPRWSYLLTAFVAGLVVDMFDQTWGLQAASCLFIAFIRKYVIDLLISKKEGLEEAEPHIGTLGFSSYILYAAILVFAHHIFLLLAEAFTLRQLVFTTFKALVNTLFTLLLIIVVEVLFFYRKGSQRG